MISHNVHKKNQDNKRFLSNFPDLPTPDISSLTDN